ncbi:MAG TPA: hypothetical protein DF383_02250 [Deltaproteobacteria bacterium]|nr:hypothetical protein [Deltaproteobacteria bacterium]
MKILREILKIILVSLVTLFVLIFFAALLILWRPQILLNEPVLRCASSLAGRFGMVISWDQAKINVENHSLLHKSFAFDFSNLCLVFSGSHGCFDKFQFAAEPAWRDGGLRLLRAGPIDISGSDLVMQLEPGAAKETKSSGFSFEMPSFLQKTAFEKVQIRLHEVEFRRGNLSFSGGIELRVDPQAEARQAQVALDSDGACIEWRPSLEQACLGKLHFEAELGWAKERLQVLRIGPAVLEQGKIVLELPRSEPAPPSRTSMLELELPKIQLPKELRETRLEAFDLHFEKVEIHQADQTYRAALQLGFQPAGETEAHLSAEGRLVEGPVLGSFELRLGSASAFLENDWHLRGEADAHLSGKGQARATFSLSQSRSKHFAFSLNADGGMSGKRGRVQADGSFAPGDVQATLSGEVSGLGEPVGKLGFAQCRLHLTQAGASERVRLSAECPLRAYGTPPRLPSGAYRKYVTIPDHLDLRVQADLQADLAAPMKQPVAGNVTVQVTPISQEFLRAQGRVDAVFSGTPSAYPRGWKFLTDFDLKLVLPEFQKLAKSLFYTPYPIPAPLNILNGYVELALRGKADLAPGHGHLPLTFKTELHSKQQSVATEGKGELDYRWSNAESKAKLDMELALSDVQITLPRFGYTSIPELFPDARLFDPKRPPSTTEVDYRLHAFTPPDKPARLVSNLAKENIPISLDITLKPEKMEGKISVGATPIRFFRRDARVEKLSILLRDPQDLSELDGRFQVTYSNVTIEILLLGTVRRPHVIFQSDPPMSEEEIISFLIYGRSFDSLDTNQSESVSDMAGAMGDRAVALASLFLLASTPIESVSYNPATGEFAARLRLAEGTSLKVGTTHGETQQVGLRKSLGKNWIINTYIENDSEEKEQRGGAFLEYYKRY